VDDLALAEPTHLVHVAIPGSRPDATDEENLAKLLREAPAGSALRYVCALAYVDPQTDQVLRSQMWAPTHSMDDRYLSLDDPVSIPAPPGG